MVHSEHGKWKIQSVPGLAAALRQTANYTLPASTQARLEAVPLVPLYQVDSGDEANEVSSATHVLATVTDKLRRLASAYGEWQFFDAPAFFDLYPEQVELLLHLHEGVTMVHVTFYADLLLPSFQRTEQYWAREFFPAYQAAHPFTQRTDLRSAYTAHFFEITQPKMVAYWQRTLSVVEAVRRELSQDIGFLAAAGGSEERDHWRQYWSTRSANGLDDALLTPLAQLPTLTLSTSFPLPAHRQPGRLRRLRRMWSHKDWHRRR
jgi:hypothetical protein